MREVNQDPRALRILMPTPRYLPHMGGVERYVATLAQRLVERGVGVTVLTTDPLRTEPRHERVNGVEILRVPAYPRSRDYYFAPELYRIMRGGGWDLVHVQSYNTLVAPLAMLAARRAQMPYVVTFHGSRLRLRRFQLTVLQPLLTRASRLVALARFEIELYGRALKLPRDRFALIRTGIDLPGNGAREHSGDGSQPVIASVGRLERFKGHHRLIEALPEILRSRPHGRIWIAGSGPYEQALRRKALELGVAERVDIHAVPVDDRQAMVDELSRVALVVLFSDAETLPLAVLEALALGRPVLVTRSRGLDELADDGLVRAVPADSGPQEIAAAVVEQLNDPFIPAHLDVPTWDECAAEHHRLYISIVERSEAGLPPSNGAEPSGVVPGVAGRAPAGGVSP